MTKDTIIPAPEVQSKVVILLVDDDKFLLDMYAMKFTQQGYAAEACTSASQALTAIRGGLAPDIILFDMTMPEQDGFSFLQALQGEHLAPQALKIALTNQNDETDKAKAAELGVARYIVKANKIPSEVVSAVVEEFAKKQH